MSYLDLAQQFIQRRREQSPHPDLSTAATEPSRVPTSLETAKEANIANLVAQDGGFPVTMRVPKDEGWLLPEGHWREVGDGYHVTFMDERILAYCMAGQVQWLRSKLDALAVRLRNGEAYLEQHPEGNPTHNAASAKWQGFYAEYDALYPKWAGANTALETYHARRKDGDHGP